MIKILLSPFSFYYHLMLFCWYMKFILFFSTREIIVEYSVKIRLFPKRRICSIFRISHNCVWQCLSVFVGSRKHYSNTSGKIILFYLLIWFSLVWFSLFEFIYFYLFCYITSTMHIEILCCMIFKYIALHIMTTYHITLHPVIS